MPRKKRNDIIAGIFILVSFGLLLLLLFLMGTFKSFFKPTKEVDVIFKEVQGLRRGEPVFFLGRKIGSVRSLKFRTYDEKVQTNKGDKTVMMSRVLVTLGVPEDSWKLLKKDSAVLVDRTITGNLRVLIGEGESNDFLHEFDKNITLRGSVAFDLDETGKKLTQALEKVNSVLTEVTTILTNLRESGQIQSIFHDISSTTEKLKESTGPVIDTVKEIASEVKGILNENRENLKTAVSNLTDSSLKLSDFFTHRLDPAAKSLEEALDNAQEAAKSLNNLVLRNGSRVENIIRSLSTSANSAETLTAEIRRRPWRLLYEPTPEEIQTLGLYDAAWAYNLSASALNHSVNELSSLAKSNENDLDDDILQKAMDQVEANLKRQKETEEAFYTMLRKRVSAE